MLACPAPVRTDLCASPQVVTPVGVTADTAARAVTVTRVPALPTPIPLPDPMPRAGRVALRAWSEEDAPFIAAAGADQHLQRFILGLPSPYTVAAAEAWIAGQGEARQLGQRLDLAVIDPVSGRLLGSVGLASVDEHHARAELGYWTAPAERRRGVATGAALLLARWAFEVLGLDRLQLLVEPVNMPSLRVAESLGAVQEGLLREYSLIAGMRRDVLMYGLLPHEIV